MKDSDVMPRQAKRQASSKVSAKRQANKLKSEIIGRCIAAGLKCEDTLGPDSKPLLKVGFRSGRELHWVHLESPTDIIEFSSITFEGWVFLSGYICICSYQDGVIEAALRTESGSVSMLLLFRRMFGADDIRPNYMADLSPVKIELKSLRNDLPDIEISPASEVFRRLAPRLWFGFGRLTLKLTSCKVKTHDDALALLKKVAGSTLFQMDQLSGIPFTLAQQPHRSLVKKALRAAGKLKVELQYPRTEFDEAPLSLYWYGRGASGMPLLQFLAFYQVVEFYFPVYSKAEAQRKLKATLKDPTFRSDRDADIGKLLSTIQISRSGAYGDERSQLRATLIECVDSDGLRAFLESDPDRRDFYRAKGGSRYHRLPIENPSADLRNDVSERIFDIRCKIVHSKSDARDEDAELLLPFSKEASELFFDIQLAKYLAQKVLITASLPLRGV